MIHFSLTDQRALITRSGQGLGLTMARNLVAAGAKVIINDVDHDCAAAAAAEFTPLRLGGISPRF